MKVNRRIRAEDLEIYNLYQRQETKALAMEKAIELIKKDETVPQIMNTYYPILCKVNYCEDVTQECYIAVITALNSYKCEKSSFVTWASKYIKNTMYQ